MHCGMKKVGVAPARRCFDYGIVLMCRFSTQITGKPTSTRALVEIALVR